jgi:FtsP/CotA-like multicopper oxidase with cupredoxin domain
MNRRDLVRLGWATVIGAGAGKLRPAFAQSPALRQVPALEPKTAGRAADFTLRIAPMMVELAPQVVLSTIGYSNQVPGPLLRLREGQRVAVEVVNDTDVPEYVHWHGLFVPSDVDGAEEEGTPAVPPHGRRRYQFVARPAGSRWYHSHTEAMLDLHRGAYTGQFGFLMIDSANDPGLYDQEVFLALREWEPYLTTMDQDEQVADPDDPMPENPPLRTRVPTGSKSPLLFIRLTTKCWARGSPSACVRVSAS